MSGPRNNLGLAKLLGVALGAFVFTFALVPLYNLACQKVFGVRLEQGPAEASAKVHDAKSERWVTVQFDGAVNSKLPWSFNPEQATLRVQPGEARDMPIRFIVDPALPDNIQTLTLSYTFFKNSTLTDALGAS